MFQVSSLRRNEVGGRMGSWKFCALNAELGVVNEARRLGLDLEGGGKRTQHSGFRRWLDVRRWNTFSLPISNRRKRKERSIWYIRLVVFTNQDRLSQADKRFSPTRRHFPASASSWLQDRPERQTPHRTESPPRAKALPLAPLGR